MNGRTTHTTIMKNGGGFFEFINSVLGRAGLRLSRTDPRNLKLVWKYARRFLYLARRFESVKHVPGDIVECGTWKGHTLLMLAYAARYFGEKRRIFGFDTFSSFPPESISPVDLPGSEIDDFGNTSKEGVERFLERNGVETDDVFLVLGSFKETLPRFEGSISLLHIDVDLYESHKDIFTHLYPKVAVGGIIAFDEYGCPKWPGATKAIDEFLSETGLTLQSEDGKHFVIKE